jgi:molecular chaperone GrpE
MSSQTEREKRQRPIGAEEEEAGEVRVTDRRRFTTGAPAPDETPAEEGGEPTGATGATGATEAKLAEAESKLAEAERQVRDYADRFRHAQAQLRAENDELRARLQRNFEQKLEVARGDLVAGLLEVLDNLKRAVAAAGEKRLADPGALAEGVRATAELFEARMRSLGLATVPAEGELFDPQVHEAVETVAVPPEQDQRVVAELQPGYKIGERLLRPARVRVGRSGD